MGESALKNSSLGGLALPVLNGTAVAEQPANFATLTESYTTRTLDFVARHGTGGARHGTPFFGALHYNHVHIPMFAAPKHNGSSIRGHYGDGVLEIDDSVGAVPTALPPQLHTDSYRRTAAPVRCWAQCGPMPRWRAPHWPHSSATTARGWSRDCR